MTRLPLVFHPGLEHELLAVLAHYESFDPALPVRFETGLDEQLDRIELWPESGGVLFESYRRVLVQRFPFMVVYDVRSDHVDVLALISVRRDPKSIEALVTERSAE